MDDREWRVRELHVVGLSPDGQHLLLAGSEDAGKPSHRIAVDARFEAALRGKRLGDLASGPALAPRDIQARLRAGATVEEVAAEAGLPVSRVQRFAGPVLSERENVLRQAHAAHQSGRRGTSIKPLEPAVSTALAALAFAKPETLAWTAYRRGDGSWVAKVSLVVRGRTKSAEWAIDTSGSVVRPVDAWASSLGHVEAPVKPPRTPKAVPAEPPAKKVPATKVPAKKVPATRASAVKTAAGQVPAKRVAKTPVKPAAAATTTAKAATTAKAPAKAQPKATGARTRSTG